MPPLISEMKSLYFIYASKPETSLPELLYQNISSALMGVVHYTLQNIELESKLSKFNFLEKESISKEKSGNDWRRSYICGKKMGNWVKCVSCGATHCLFFFLSSLKEIQKSDFLKVPRGILRLNIYSRGWEVAVQGVCACVCKWRRLYPIFTPPNLCLYHAVKTSAHCYRQYSLLMTYE